VWLLRGGQKSTLPGATTYRFSPHTSLPALKIQNTKLIPEQNIDPIAIIIFIPLCDKVFYPGLRKIGIEFKPITRITWGFFFGAFAMAYAAGVQQLIYNTGPCYSSPSDCAAGANPDGSYTPNRVHVAVQTPAYVLIAFSEIFASITGLEYAFTKAPQSMKSWIMSLFLLTNAFGSALSIALTPTAEDPKLVWMYTGLCVACFIAGCIFWVVYHRYNATEESMNALDQYTEKPAHLGEGEDAESNLEKSLSVSAQATPAKS